MGIDSVVNCNELIRSSPRKAQREFRDFPEKSLWNDNTYHALDIGRPEELLS